MAAAAGWLVDAGRPPLAGVVVGAAWWRRSVQALKWAPPALACPAEVARQCPAVRRADEERCARMRKRQSPQPPRQLPRYAAALTDAWIQVERSVAASRPACQSVFWTSSYARGI